LKLISARSEFTSFWSSFARLRVIGPSYTCLCVTWVNGGMSSSPRHPHPHAQFPRHPCAITSSSHARCPRRLHVWPVVSMPASALCLASPSLQVQGDGSSGGHGRGWLYGSRRRCPPSSLMEAPTTSLVVVVPCFLVWLPCRGRSKVARKTNPCLCWLFFRFSSWIIFYIYTWIYIRVGSLNMFVGAHIHDGAAPSCI
jgi:hypothetical protein